MSTIASSINQASSLNDTFQHILMLCWTVSLDSLIIRPLLKLHPLAFSILKLHSRPSSALTQVNSKPFQHAPLITYHTPSLCLPAFPHHFSQFSIFLCPRSFGFPVTHPISLCVQGSLCVNAASNNPSLCAFVCLSMCVLGTDSSEMGFWTSPLSLQNRHRASSQHNLLLALPCSP